MRQANISPVKASIVFFTAMLMGAMLSTSYAQQYVIANKDNTRPEMDRLSSAPITINSFSANAFNGYNDVQWNVFSDRDVRKFVVEYSMNGVDYQTAAEVAPSGTQYNLRHAIADKRPVLYRIRTEQINGAMKISAPFFLSGEAQSPVTIYPTVISGNMINIKAAWPIERIIIVSGDGTQVFAKEIAGQKDFIPVAIPSLSKGMYWVASFGNGWKTTEKIIVP